MTKREGLCAGGPGDGKKLAAATPRVVVPIEIPGDSGFGQGVYLWNDDARMWIWQADWPIRPRIR